MRSAAVLLFLFFPAFAVEPVIERSQPATIYALGDIHGDYDRMILLLRAAGVIGADDAWAARDSVLVVTGDMIDKGPRPLDVLRFLARLRNTAAEHRGEVILLAGNHEAEFLAGPDARKAADFLQDLKHAGIKPEDVIACRGDVGEALCSLPFAARVGEWFFCHAGNTAGRTIPRILADLRAGFAAERYATSELLGPDSILEARLGEGKGWMAVPGKTERDVLASYVRALGVRHIVQGHQHNVVRFDDGVERRAGEMFQRWGLLFLIDVGMIGDIDDSPGALLEISPGAATAICPNGVRTLLWSDQKQPDTGRAVCTPR
jgi:hypothetical protein